MSKCQKVKLVNRTETHWNRLNESLEFHTYRTTHVRPARLAPQQAATWQGALRDRLSPVSIVEHTMDVDFAIFGVLPDQFTMISFTLRDAFRT